MENKELRELVSKLFKENEIHHDFNVSNSIVDVSVEWGDWKHELSPIPYTRQLPTNVPSVESGI